MNNQMQEFAKKTLKEGLAQLPDDWQMMFKRMYSHDNLDTPISDVVDNMPDDKLDWAMRQVENTLKKVRHNQTNAADTKNRAAD